MTATNATIIGNSATIDGGGLWSSASSVSITSSGLTDNSADINGGGIWMSDGTLTTKSSKIGTPANTAGQHGGSFFLEDTKLVMGDCTVGGTATNGDGGGLFFGGGDFDIQFSEFDKDGIPNAIKGSGGGIRLMEGELTLLSTEVVGFAGKNGGGISATGGKLTANLSQIGGSAIGTETEVGKGGGIYTTTTTTLSSCFIGAKSVAGLGGGIYTSDNSPTITLSTVCGESTETTVGDSGKGGAMFVDSSATVTVKTSLIDAGKADQLGGNIYCQGTLTINSSTIRYGESKKGGGGVYLAGGSFELKSSTVNGNVAVDPDNPYTEIFGGGIFMADGDATITNCTISGNKATHGGGIVFDSDYTTLKNCTVTDNTAMGIVVDQGPDVAGEGGGVLVRNNNTIVSLTQSTIIAHNTRIVGDSNNNSTGPDIHNESSIGTVDARFSLIGVADVGFTKSDGWLMDPDNQDNREGTLSSALSPGLDILDFNGGPDIGYPPDDGRFVTHRLLPNSEAIDRGNNFSGSNFDQRGPNLVRVYDLGLLNPPGDSSDIGAYERQSPRVTGVMTFAESSTTLSSPNDVLIRPSKSRVTFMNIHFDQPVEINNLALAFSIERLITINLDPNLPTGAVPFTLEPIGINNAGNTNLFKMRFDPGPFTESEDPTYNSLIDGRYKLTISASEVSVLGLGLAGNLNGDPASDYNSEEDPNQPSRRIWRLFGDVTGSGSVPNASVTSNDFAAFLATYGLASDNGLVINPAFECGVDFDGDGHINSFDFVRFRLRFGISI